MMSSQVTLLFDDVFNDPLATITVTSEDASFPALNARDWRAWTWWRGTANPSTIRAQFAADRTADGIFVAAHDLFTKGAALTVASSPDGSAWTTRATVTPAADVACWIGFASVAAKYWRVSMNGTLGASVGVIILGKRATEPVGQWGGEVPHDLARNNTLLNTESESGTFLGRSVLRRAYDIKVNLEYLTRAWIDTYYLPWMIHAEVRPFGVVWPTPADGTLAAASFAWLTDAPPPPTIMQQDWHKAGFTAKAQR